MNYRDCLSSYFDVGDVVKFHKNGAASTGRVVDWFDAVKILERNQYIMPDGVNKVVVLRDSLSGEIFCANESRVILIKKVKAFRDVNLVVTKKRNYFLSESLKNMGDDGTIKPSCTVLYPERFFPQEVQNHINLLKGSH